MTGTHHDHSHAADSSPTSSTTPSTPTTPDAPGVRPPRQEQLPASDEITEVAPGVLRMQLPISMPGLGHVNCYALEDERGVAVVDPGLPGKESFRVLTARLKQAGFPLKRVHSVIVTHSHPDHFGGAGRLRLESGADVIAHRSFNLWWDPTEPDDLGPEELAEYREFVRNHRHVTPWGGTPPRPPFKRRVQMDVRRRLPRLFGTPKPSVRLDDAQTIRLARRDWVAVHTPGHTADHLCLFDPTEGTLLSGDHVLPTITPHISGLLAAADPLQQFFDSLNKIAAVGAKSRRVLPAHGHPFDDLKARTDAIQEHHIERLEKLRTGGRDIGRFATVPELSQVLFSARAQGSMADSETFAHIEHLRLRGEIEQRTVGDHREYLLH